MNEEFDQFDGGESPPHDEDIIDSDAEEPKFSSKEERIIEAVKQMIYHENIPFRNLRDFWQKASKQLDENTRFGARHRIRILGTRLAFKYEELRIRDERLPDAQQYINRVWRERRAAEAAQRLRDRVAAQQRAAAVAAAKEETPSTLELPMR
ncbi:unnamed protein product [Zymoseptoria tritici ST99CH_1A5]|uniref:Uncharacterized protein n=2 Tax=Zymoseptoria tritici TaxID=1047171 RepID=A0A1X7S0N2_ZYMT9|nr:unnamed protein product [Zymoseptoria tritici ST99CH_3D7]SMY26872.1 unnamed protein product [Zymoseptoria tritici ST99CH_1A5]